MSLPKSFEPKTPSIDDISRDLSDEQIQRESRNTAGSRLLTNFKNCLPGNDKNVEGKRHCDIFEDLCEELLRFTLRGEFRNLALKPQIRSRTIPGYKSSQKDFLLFNNPKSADPNCLWTYFRTKYGADFILFECKNYTGDITDGEINQVEEYLTTQVGKLAIIMCRNGKCDTSANSAIQRLSLKGYSVWILGDNDFEELIKAYVENNSVESFFADKYTETVGKLGF